ncbi:MAG: hypothetical protein L3K19_00245 [Thermoplasmata archaeon]|nr:hypothetical protein [Thermoplasmata archaeon]
MAGLLKPPTPLQKVWAASKNPAAREAGWRRVTAHRGLKELEAKRLVLVREGKAGLSDPFDQNLEYWRGEFDHLLGHAWNRLRYSHEFAADIAPGKEPVDAEIESFCRERFVAHARGFLSGFLPVVEKLARADGELERASVAYSEEAREDFTDSSECHRLFAKLHLVGPGPH